jgi:glucose/mannose-6-phosphate isomerase
MKALIEGFPAQLRDALSIFRNTTLRPLPRTPHHIVVTGLGGSGIGGSILADIASERGALPVWVSKEYALPSWVNENTLLIVSSYSGDTEETVKSMQQALNAGAMIVCICSGGSIARMAKANNLDCINIPGGNPPRACLGYSLVQLIGIYERFGFINGALQEVEASIALLEQKAKAIQTEAEAIARTISFSFPVIYCTPGYEGVTIRFRQQLNENAKMLCWHQVIPEMNHNELVGWADKQARVSVLFFSNNDDYYRTARRREIVAEILHEKAGRMLELNSLGESRIEKLIYWIHLGDWISWFASVEKDVDAMEIDVIHRLKAELSNLP